MNEVKELAIIGGGPAGISAGVYAARKELHTTLIAESFGGQSSISLDIHNWIGTPSISGIDLAEQFETHIRKYEGDVLTIISSQITDIKEKNDIFTLTTKKGEQIYSRTLLMATGATRRKLNTKGAEKFEHKGVTYCASCDGPFFKDKDVFVIGGGNAGFETAAQLLAYTKSVTLLNRGNTFKADATTIKKVTEHPKMNSILNAEILEISGDAFVNSIRYTIKDEKEKTEEVQGIFVEIGNMPATKIAEGLTELDDYKRIKTDPKTQQTSHPRIWAAGDCTDALYHQNNIASGDAIKALENIYLTLRA